jgi:hypothetical protein
LTLQLSLYASYHELQYLPIGASPRSLKMISLILSPERLLTLLAPWLLALIIVFDFTPAAWPYVPDERWSSTANNPSTGSDGDPVTLTWGFVSNSTQISGEGASNLLTFLDNTFGAGPGGSNLTQRPWFHFFSESFARWSQVGGITYVYQAQDDSAAINPLNPQNGVVNVRPDVRIGGASIDGESGTLAYSWFPDMGDIIFDTDDDSFFTGAANNHRAFRNTIMHEIGHAFGLDHVVSDTNDLLMEPFIDTDFDGPQLDDIRGIQGMYGDPREKTGGGQGNDAAANASAIGTLHLGSTLRVGTAAAPDQVVGPTETDFVSIANSGDTDYFSFIITTPTALSATLTPLGGVFNQGAEDESPTPFNANARNNLSLAIFAPNGTTQLGLANTAATGQVESLSNVTLPNPGQYYARITGADANVQLYQLELSASLLGDYNRNGAVDAADYALWKKSVNQTGPNLAADGNGNNVVDGGDLTVWRSNFGNLAAGGGGSGLGDAAIPEPAGVVILIEAAVLAYLVPRRTRLPDQNPQENRRCRTIHRWLVG